MKKILLVLSFVMLSGCSTITEWIPSRWDVNQAKVITDIQQQTRHFDCKADQVAQLNDIAKNVEWFDIYSKTKPTKDISKLTGTIITTIKEYQDRLKQGPVSPMYCDLKLKLIKQQADILAGSVQGRF
jgi:outer membrane protein assembly factor BamE (lipoprotein component of BamABCDE complex)